MRYLIKKTYRATEKNEAFKGQTRILYCGPDGAHECFSKDTDKELRESSWYLKERAYKSKASLAKGLKAQERNRIYEEGAGFWTFDLEVVEIGE